MHFWLTQSLVVVLKLGRNSLVMDAIFFHSVATLMNIVFLVVSTLQWQRRNTCWRWRLLNLLLQGLMKVYLTTVLEDVGIVLRVWFMKMLILVTSTIAFLYRPILLWQIALSQKQGWTASMLLLGGKVNRVIQFASQEDNHASQINSWCLIIVTLYRNTWAAREVAWQVLAQINLLKLFMTPRSIWIRNHVYTRKHNLYFLVMVHISTQGDCVPVRSFFAWFFCTGWAVSKWQLLFWWYGRRKPVQSIDLEKLNIPIHQPLCCKI